MIEVRKIYTFWREVQPLISSLTKLYLVNKEGSFYIIVTDNMSYCIQFFASLESVPDFSVCIKPSAFTEVVNSLENRKMLYFAVDNKTVIFSTEASYSSSYSLPCVEETFQEWPWESDVIDLREAVSRISDLNWAAEYPSYKHRHDDTIIDGNHKCFVKNGLHCILMELPDMDRFDRKVAVKTYALNIIKNLSYLSSLLSEDSYDIGLGDRNLHFSSKSYKAQFRLMSTSDMNYHSIPYNFIEEDVDLDGYDMYKFDRNELINALYFCVRSPKKRSGFDLITFTKDSSVDFETFWNLSYRHEELQYNVKGFSSVGTGSIDSFSVSSWALEYLCEYYNGQDILICIKKGKPVVILDEDFKMISLLSLS